MNAITLSELKMALPQAFVEAPSSRVSAKYSFIPTSVILTDLDKLGWKIREIKNPKYKSTANQSHGKHLVRLYNPDIHISNGADQNFVEIALYNSSNGLSKFKMEIGIFRFVCENGMVVKSHDFGSINMRHLGYSFDTLKASIDEMISKLPELAGKINQFTAKELTTSEIQGLARAAYDLRGSGRTPNAEEIAEILKVRRPQDAGNSLWVVLNRLQESVVRGGNMFIDARGRMRTQKPLINLDKSLKANQELWELAESYC